MHDALNAIHREYAPYAYSGAAKGADPTTAAAQAAYEIAVSQYPGRNVELKRELDTWLASVKDRPAKTKGITLGRASAAAILKQREGDRWDGTADYTWRPAGPGVYTQYWEHSQTYPGFVFGAGWAAAKPFVLTKPDQFRAPPPPRTDSEEYAEAYNEVKEVGRFRSASRTSDQTHLAMWWKDFVENSHNALARQIVTTEKPSVRAATRMFALLNTSVYDAYISVFENKFFYNHWRPYTAIRYVEDDGNQRTEPDPEWTNTHTHTYPSPSYPSAHATGSAAAMTILAKIFGDDYAFTMTTLEVDEGGPRSQKIRLDPATRLFKSFSSAALEAGMSRVYLGIHFRYDAVEGNRLGTRIGNYAWDHLLQPVK
jgi:membrane-associated phospholipid phosphatase